MSFIADRANAGAVANTIDDANITTLAIEMHKSCLTRGSDPVIGGWTSASIRQGSLSFEKPFFDFDFPEDVGGAWVQVSRLGMPLVNEVVIGLKDKNLFNASEPIEDGQFLSYVTNPTLPAILETLFGVQAPCTPRNDLVSVFLTGIEGVNQPVGIVPSEMLRLNTSVPPTARAFQSNLGVIGGDLAGYPNGRRPGDDVVDISLRVVMGALLPPECAPDGQLPYTDGAFVNDIVFSGSFPYLNLPLPGSPNDG